MAQTTTFQELEALRTEIEALQEQKVLQKKQKEAKLAEAAEVRQQEITEIEKSAEKVLNSVREGTADAKETFHQLLEGLRKDYENISPASAIVLFALGAIFGYAFSSRSDDEI